MNSAFTRTAVLEIITKKGYNMKCKKTSLINIILVRRGPKVYIRAIVLRNQHVAFQITLSIHYISPENCVRNAEPEML